MEISERGCDRGWGELETEPGLVKYEGAGPDPVRRPALARL